VSSPRLATRDLPGQPPRMEYRLLHAAQPLPATALCAIRFGSAPHGLPEAPWQGVSIHLNLQPLAGTDATELWHVDAPVHAGEDGPVRFASSGRYLAGTVEIDERAAGGLAAAAREAYAAISRFTAQVRMRMYNYFSDINAGEGDEERYKQFCHGRASGLRERSAAAWPAATAIGRQDHGPVLQVYWLAGAEPGRAIENPRQLSAFQYPRQYGPSPPSFSRAMQVSGALLVSGTASILGHRSHHAGDLQAQLEEILRNLHSLRQADGGGPSAQAGRSTLLKIYLRDTGAAGFVATYLRARLPPTTRFVILGADICRRELLVEIDAADFGREPHQPR
jgi:chorismate lyase / 3-hydroxybenzoate synthase